MKPTLHVLANPHGITDLRYRMDPFNIAVAKFITNLSPKGYEIIHYGHEQSRVDCENVPVIFQNEVTSRGPDDLFVHNPKTTKLFCQRTNQQLQKRYKPNDLILCFFGQDHQEATVNDKNWIVVEPAIGYRPECIFAPYRVFTSYAIMHYFYGLNNMLSTPSWFDTVIPNAFTPSEFTFQEHKQDYLLYLGRLNWDKGIDLAIQVAERAQRRLLIAGPGSLKDLNYTSIPKHVELVGYADVEKRRNLLKDAYALIAPTYYIEPFGNIVIEAAMSGTPVITTDWGGFCDTVIPGVTGYRCKNFHGFVHSVDEIKKIKPQNCRNWAMSNYSDEIVHDRFDRYFQYLTSRDFYYAEN